MDVSRSESLAMKVSWLFPTREYTMLPAKDTDQVLNINESTTDSPIQETSDNASRFYGIKRFCTEYLSRETYVSIISIASSYSSFILAS